MAVTVIKKSGSVRSQMTTQVSAEASGIPAEGAPAVREIELDNRLMEAYPEARLDVLEERLSELRGTLNLHSWILALIGASTIIPALGGLL